MGLKLLSWLIISLFLSFAVLADDASCGNTICEQSSPYVENKDNCPQDCGLYNATRDIWAIYRTKDSTENYLRNLADLYNGSYEVIGHSLDGREILLFKFGNPDGGKFMFDGQVHGPEDCGTEAGIEFVTWAVSSDDPEAINVRNGNYLLFIPIINRDLIKRQNHRRNYTLKDGSIIYAPFGVDLNRNFVYGWGNSGSGDPNNSYEYRGLSAGSEPETQAVRYAMQKYKPQVYANVHCGMETLSGGGNATISAKIISNIRQIQNSTGARSLSYYGGGYSSTGACGSGGFAKADGCAFGASSWLFEISTWDHLPKTLRGFLDKWYPQAFPVYLGMAKAIQKLPQVEQNNTMNDTSPIEGPTKTENITDQVIAEIPESDVDTVSDSDFRNFFGIMWVGDPCENLNYAKTMGYDYVSYQNKMEKCPASLRQNMHFYFESPENYAMANYYTWEIDILKSYTPEQIASYNSVFTWKGSADENTPFPDNLATGWWFTNKTFRPLIDLQQQKMIDFAINRALVKVASLENKSIGWEFGGWSWDVPDFKGDWWTARQAGYTGTNWSCFGVPCKGKIVALSYWNPNGIDSGALHTGITHEYSTYPEANSEFFKQLYASTREIYPDFKIYYQPYNLYSSYIKLIENRSDRFELMPPKSVIFCQESADSPTNDLLFMNDARIYSSGLITKDYVCNDNPDNHDHDRNLAMAATAAINGGWMSFFGRWGGTDGTPSYKRVYEVPDALKLIRAVPNWDNKAGIPLSNRSWDAANHIYWSSNSYADLNLIATRHPDTKEIFIVFLNKSESLGVSRILEIWSTDGTFQKKVRADSDFSYDGTYLTLLSADNENKGYVLVNNNNITINESPIPNKINDSEEQELNFQKFKIRTRKFGTWRNTTISSNDGLITVEFSSDINITKIRPERVGFGRRELSIDDLELQHPAIITMRNIFPNFVLLRNNETCGSYCHIISYNNYILRFSVPSFSSYKVVYETINGTTYEYSTAYDKNDLQNIMVDAVGTAGASITSLMDLIILALVLSMIAGLIVKFKK